MTLGTPGQTLLFNFDTGSDYLWAPNVVCTGCQINNIIPGYSTTTDTAETSLGFADGISYMDGSSFNGTVYETVVSSGTVSATGVNFLLVSQWYDSAGSTDYHGLCGLSASILSDYSELLVTKWAEQGAIPKDMFSINYKSDADAQDTYIYFGGYETSIVTSESDITWFKLTGSGFWEIEATHVFYGDSKSSLGRLDKAIIDTGSSISYIPLTVLDSIASATKLSC